VIPKESKVIQYYLGARKHRVMAFQRCNLLKAKFKPQVLDRYPESRPGFPLKPHIAQFCFPSGIQLHSDPQIPKAFSFILTDADGTRTYTTVLFFDEVAP
jgi:hypothetical protein